MVVRARVAGALSYGVNGKCVRAVCVLCAPAFCALALMENE
jgi:hypothetical protein